MRSLGGVLVALFALGLCGSLPVAAQTGGELEEPEVGPALPPGSNPVLVDRIVAVVDEEPILLSDLEREIESYRFEAEAYGENVDEDPAEVRRKMLDRLIEVKLLVAQAKLDGFVIGEEELEQEVERAMQTLIERFGSRTALERELERSGMTYQDLRARNRELVRNRLYTSRMINAHIRPEVEVLDNEVETYYREHENQLPRRPDQVTLANILVVPQPSDEVAAGLQERIREIQRVLQTGTSFDDVARRYSEGPNAGRGGMVGTFKRGDLFNPILEEAAWVLPVGEISEPINTELGVHILQVTQRTDDEVTLRQILVRVEITPEDRQEARQRADQVVELARAGEDFGELARRFSDDPGTRERGGELGTFPIAQLSSGFQEAISGLEPGEVADPVQGAAGYFVLKLVDRQQGGAFSYDEVKEDVRNLLLDQKIQAELEIFLAELRNRFFIEIKA